MAPIAALRDDFADNIIAAAWDASATGSATVAETSGEARCTLPSSTVGSHLARYTSHSPYDLTAGSFYVNIDTMVSTSVAATAFFQLYIDGGNALQWTQLSGTLKAVSIVGGVSTDEYSVTWNASTYKYLRIRESGGNIEWHSSSNGTTWTLRATLAAPFTLTALYVDFGAACGNVASPGSFRLDDVNLILPALSTTWNWTQVVWPLEYRYMTITSAIDAAGTVQGYVSTSDAVDVSGNPTAPVRWWSGPADGGRVLTEQTSQASAEAMAVDLPLNGRFDLPEMVEARCIRVYHRSIDGAAYAFRELYPRRLVQADDIEAESIRALHIAAASITADRLSVTDLSAITANIGQLTITKAVGNAWIYQGTGTGDAPTTGLKIYNSAGIGKLSTYKAGVEQITIDTDGALKWAAGGGLLDADGLRIAAGTTSAYGYLQPLAITFEHTDGNVGRIFGTRVAAGQRTFAIQGDQGSSTDHVEIGIQVDATGGSGKEASIRLDAQNSVGLASIIVQSLATGPDIGLSANTVSIIGDTTFSGGLNVGTATGATAGQVRGSGYLMASGVGTLPASAVLAMGYDAGSTRGLLVAINSGAYLRLDIEALDLRLKYQSTNRIQINSTGIGFFAATPVAKPTVTGSRGGNAALASFLTAAANLGLITNSSTA